MKINICYYNIEKLNKNEVEKGTKDYINIFMLMIIKLIKQYF